MNREVVQTNAATVRLRRLGRVARRRMRIDGDALRNGTHTNGQLTVQISGLGASAAGVPESFTWQADRPIALVIVRSGIDGDDVAFITGPAIAGEGRSAGVGDGSGIRYDAYCYDAKNEKRPGSDDAGPRARPGFDIRAAFGRLNRAGSTA
jgi:hypothetical protein